MEHTDEEWATCAYSNGFKEATDSGDFKGGAKDYCNEYGFTPAKKQQTNIRLKEWQLSKFKDAISSVYALTSFPDTQSKLSDKTIETIAILTKLLIEDMNRIQ